MKKKVLALLAAAGIAALGMTAFAEETQRNIPDGAIFHKIDPEDLSIEDSEAYIYVASVLCNLPNWETPVFYVYPDEYVADEDAAWDLLQETGLQELAESSRGCVMVVNPLGGTYDEDDMELYDALMGYVYYNKTDRVAHPGEVITDPPVRFGYSLTYCNLQYMIGEGAGATFINTYMTQKPNRVAGVLTFGGEMPESDNIVAPVPAYLVGSSDQVVEYYKAMNEVNREKLTNGVQTYYSYERPVQKVMVSDSDASSFDADEISAAYNNLLRWSMRMALTSTINSNFYTDEMLTLIERPNTEELGLKKFYVADTGVEGQSRWVVWIPEEALEENNTQKFPLVIDHHGGHVSPSFEPEAQGWIQLAGEERFIVFAPEGPEQSGGAEMTLESLNVLLDEYPFIDTSRIYATGFSRGGGQVNEMIMEYNYMLAAASCMASADAGLDYEASEAMQKYELPWIFSVGTGERPDGLNERDTLGVNSSLLMNHLTVPEEYDYDTYPYWGLATEIGGLNYTTPDGFDVVSRIIRNDDGIPMVQFTYVTELQHVHYTEYARIHWNFMKNYARNTETGEVIYLPDAENVE